MQRLNRLDFLVHCVFSTALQALMQSLLLIFFIRLTHETPGSPSFWIGIVAVVGALLAVIASVYYGLRVLICRLHDTNISGWCLLLVLVPFLNIALLLWMLFRRGSRRRNAYGRPEYHVLSPMMFVALLVLSLTSILYSQSLLHNPKHLMSIEMFLDRSQNR